MAKQRVGPWSPWNKSITVLAIPCCSPLFPDQMPYCRSCHWLLQSPISCNSRTLYWMVHQIATTWILELSCCLKDELSCWVQPFERKESPPPLWPPLLQDCRTGINKTSYAEHTMRCCTSGFSCAQESDPHDLVHLLQLSRGATNIFMCWHRKRAQHEESEANLYLNLLVCAVISLGKREQAFLSCCFCTKCRGTTVFPSVAFHL